MHKSVQRPILMILAVLVCLAMLRLGIWQLDRADQKQQIVDQSIHQSNKTSLDLNLHLKTKTASSLKTDIELQRYRMVEFTGEYLTDHTLYVENQVYRSQVGYRVFTLMQIHETNHHALVDRGWISAGVDRSILPQIKTPRGALIVTGRLNKAIAQPPLWNEDYDVNTGNRWQYLPLDKLQEQLGLSLLPLVVELSPDYERETSVGLVRHWSSISEQQVGKHKAYALQWFAMAVALLLASLFLLMKSNNSNVRQHEE